jgi:ketosteroid isomerase-like protein
MDHDAGIAFGRRWNDAWNAHDLDAVLALLHPDVAFSSPHVPTIAGEPSGVLHGKRAVRAYWAEALRRMPDLHFDLLGVTVGHDAVAIRYTNQAGMESVEILLLDDDGLVIRGAGTYAAPVA